MQAGRRRQRAHRARPHQPGAADEGSIQQVETPDGFRFATADASLSLADFQVTRDTLGEGAFGKVRRCLHTKSGDVYALKRTNARAAAADPLALLDVFDQVRKDVHSPGPSTVWNFSRAYPHLFC